MLVRGLGWVIWLWILIRDYLLESILGLLQTILQILIPWAYFQTLLVGLDRSNSLFLRHVDLSLPEVPFEPRGSE